MTSLKKIYKKTTLILSFVVLGSLFYAPNTTSALTLAEGLEACKVRIKKAQCEEAVKACATNICRTNAVNNVNISGTKVMLDCRTTADPQKCHSEVVAKCGGKTGTALTDCRKSTITSLFSGAGSGLGVGSGVSLSPKADVVGAKPTCGKGEQEVKLRFNLGCEHKVDNPIVDMAYAFIKFLAIGVGLILALSIIFAGIMYTTSGGSPEQTSKAKDRILNAMVGLIFYLLISALANFLIPGGLF